MKIVCLKLLLLLVCGHSLANPMTFTAHDDEEKDPYRLDGAYIPKTYNIKLTVLKDFHTTKKFNGEVTIMVEKKNDTAKEIQLHMDEIIEKNVEIVVDGKAIARDQTSYDSTTQIKKIKVDTAETLEFKFEGKLYPDTDMYGFYVSQVNDKEFIATTQFQPTFARRAFPCFDEPEYKAKFTIALEVPRTFKAMSNQPIESNILNKYTFKETPEMSTYLVAFVVSKFESTPVDGATDTPMKIWAPKSLKHNAAYAAKYSHQIIDKLGKTLSLGGDELAFGKMKIEQLDQVAIPDFAAGAMENWGLVTYRETALLVDNDKPKAKDQERVATVIAHEFAHSWFGDWVTMKWWKDAWLNEGFATYFESHGIKDIEDFKHFQLEKQFVLEKVHPIMETDGNLGALPLSSGDQEISTVDEIQAKFGTITYSKGGSIIRMMEKIVGEANFYKALNAYISSKKTFNTDPTDLFKEFDNVFEHIPKFSEIMKNWVYESGYPVVTASLDNGLVKVTQKQFLYDESEVKDEKPLKWYVPIFWKTHDISAKTSVESIQSTPVEPTDLATEPEGMKIISPEQDLELQNLENKIIIINSNNAGFYRVNYDEELWDRIIKLLKTKHTEIDEVTRAQLINDAMNLARADQLPYKVAMELLSYLEHETDYYPWKAAFTAFSFLRKRLVGDDLRNDITSTMQTLMAKLYTENKDFEITNDDAINAISIYTKVLALEWACEMDHPECIANALAQFKPDDNTGDISDEIDPNLQSVVYCSALKHAKDSEEAENNWNALWTKYGEVPTAAQKVTILTALGCTKETQLLKAYLEKSITESSIRAQDASTVINAVLTGNPEGVEISLDFLLKSFPEIVKKYGSMGALSKIILQVADRITTEPQMIKFAEFVETHRDKLGEAEKVADNALKAAQANKKWTENTKEKLNEYYQKDSDDSEEDTDGGASSLTSTGFALMLCFIAARFM